MAVTDVRSADVIVIGAGMGGLAAAARLAKLGHRVHVIERGSTYGGKVHRVEHQGFRFDVGPSLLTLPAVYRDLFLKTATKKATARLEDNLDLQSLDEAFAYRWTDGSHVLLPGAGVNRVIDALGAALGAHAADEWSRLLHRASDIWAATRVPFLESPLSRRDLLRNSRRLSDLRTVAPWRSLRGLGRSYIKDPRLAVMLDRYATYSGSDPRRAPAALAVIPYVEQTFGAWHIGGGLFELARAVFDRCVELGVTFSFDTEVISVATEAGGGVTGVDIQATNGDQRRLPTSIVVSDGDAATLYGTLLDDARTRQPLRAIRRATPSFSGFAILIAASGRTPAIAHHNVWFPDNYDDEFDAVFSQQPAVDPAIYACVPDDPQMRPDDSAESWFILVNAPRHDPRAGFDWSDTSVVDGYTDTVLATLAARGVDLRSRTLWRQVLSPAELESRTASPGGAIYGTSSNGARSAFLRPANRSPIPGLFLVGGSAHPGGGLPLVGLGAAIVAAQIGPPNR